MMGTSYYGYGQQAYTTQYDIEENFRSLLQAIKKKPTNLSKYEVLCQRNGISNNVINDISEEIPNQKINWRNILYSVIPESVWDMYKNGFRIYSTSEVYKHFESARQKHETLSWQPDRIWVWVAQCVATHCQKANIDFERFKTDLNKILQVIPEEYQTTTNDGIMQILQKIEAQMIQDAIISVAENHVHDTSWLNTYKKANASSPTLNTSSAKSPVDPWIIETFDKNKFATLKDARLTKLWDNVQGTSGGFDNVARSIMSEIENLFNEEVEPSLYQKNMTSFVRAFYQAFQERIQKAQLGIAAWYYDGLEDDLKTKWVNGPHYYPAACLQWRGDKESLKTLNIGGVKLAVLRGLSEIEAKNTQREQKINEVKRLVESWTERFQEVPKVIDAVQPVEAALDEIVDSGSVWPILAELTQKNMSTAGYKNLVKEVKEAATKKDAGEWVKVSKVRKACFVPWGKKSDEEEKQGKAEKKDATQEMVDQLIGKSGNADVMKDPNKALEKGLQQFFKAAFS